MTKFYREDKVKNNAVHCWTGYLPILWFRINHYIVVFHFRSAVEGEDGKWTVSFYDIITAVRYWEQILEPHINQLDDEELQYFQQDGSPKTLKWQ